MLILAILLILTILTILLILAILLILPVFQLFPGVDVALLGLQIFRIQKKSLLESIHGRFVILLLQGYVSLVEIPAGSIFRLGQLVSHFVQGSGRIFVILLHVEG